MEQRLPPAERVEFRKSGSAAIATFLLALVSGVAVATAAAVQIAGGLLSSALVILTVALACLTLSLVLFVGRILFIRGPIVVIDENGIVDRRLGREPIPWTKIKRVEWRTFAGHPTIGLWLTDRDDIRGTLTLVGRLEMMVRGSLFPSFPPIEIEELGLDQHDRRLLTIAIVRFSRHPLQGPAAPDFPGGRLRASKTADCRPREPADTAVRVYEPEVERQSEPLG